MVKRKRGLDLGQCSLCPYVSCEDNLILHINTFHKKRQKESNDFPAMVNRRRYPDLGRCNLCPYVSCEEDLIWHVNNVHKRGQKESNDFLAMVKRKRPDLRQCNLCPYVSCEEDLIWHVNNVHKRGQKELNDFIAMVKRRRPDLGQCNLCPYVSCEEDLIWHVNNVHKRGQKESNNFYGKNHSQFLNQVTKYPKHRHGSSVIKGIYYCEVCFFNTKHFGGLLQHIEKVHCYNLIYCCKHCNYISSLFGLAKHYIENHSSGLYKNCILCLYSSYSVTNTLQHLSNIHRPNKTVYNCLCCPRMFSRLSSLICHSESRHKFSFEESFNLTNIIDLYFNNINEWSRVDQHIQYVNCVPLTLNSRGLISKSVLHKYFERKFNLINTYFSNIIAENESRLAALRDKDKPTSFFEFAKDAQLKELSLKCEFCWFFTFDEYSLTQHVRDAHNIINIYQCLRCLSFYNNSVSLDEHLRVLHKSEVVELKCTICSYYTCVNLKLYQHVRSHDIFDNQVINRTYSSNNYTSSVNFEEIHHLNQSSYIHSYSSYSFSRNSNLTTYTKSEHKFLNRTNGTSVNSKREKGFKYIGNVCETKSKIKSKKNKSKNKSKNLVIHGTNVLDCVSPSALFYKCEHCPYSTLRKIKLNRHVILKHSSTQDLFKCSNCSYLSNKLSSLKEHAKAKHKMIICETSMLKKNKEMVNPGSKSSQFKSVKKNNTEKKKSAVNHSDNSNLDVMVRDSIVGVLHKCPHCSRIAPTRLDLSRHLQNSHSGPKVPVFDSSKFLNIFKTTCNNKCMNDEKSNIVNLGSEVFSEQVYTVLDKEAANEESTVIERNLVELNQQSDNSGTNNGENLPFTCNCCPYNTFKISDFNQHVKDKHEPSVHENPCSEVLPYNDTCLGNHAVYKQPNEIDKVENLEIVGTANIKSVFIHNECNKTVSEEKSISICDSEINDSVTDESDPLSSLNFANLLML